MAYRVLGQVTSSSTSNNEVTLYTAGSQVSGTTQAIVSTINVCNTGSYTQKYSIAVKKAADAGSSTVTKQYLVNNTVISPNSTVSYTLGITLAAGDLIVVKSDAVSTVAFNAFGSELS